MSATCCDAARRLAAVEDALRTAIGRTWRELHANRSAARRTGSRNGRLFYGSLAQESAAALRRLLAVRRALRGGGDS